MTTIINLNIVNFTGMKVEKKTLNINQPDTARSKRREISPTDYRTIDITPKRPVITGDYHSADNISKIQAGIADRPEVLMCYPVKNQHYGSKAYSSRCFIPKGTYIDSYV